MDAGVERREGDHLVGEGSPAGPDVVLVPDDGQVGGGAEEEGRGGRGGEGGVGEDRPGSVIGWGAGEDCGISPVFFGKFVVVVNHIHYELLLRDARELQSVNWGRG